MVVDSFSGIGRHWCGVDSMESVGFCNVDIAIARIGLHVVRPSVLALQKGCVTQNADGYSDILGDCTGMVRNLNRAFCDDTVFRRSGPSWESASDIVAWNWTDGLGVPSLYSATDWAAVG